jgi:RHS repeat-associated protein
MSRFRAAATTRSTESSSSRQAAMETSPPARSSRDTIRCYLVLPASQLVRTLARADAGAAVVGMSGSLAGAGFAYDPFGRRASKTVGGATAQFQYDGDRVVQEIQPGAGNVLTDMGFSRTDLAGNMTFLGDLLGSTLALANDAGAVATEYSYEPFGASMASGAASSNPYQFAFHQNDETGLYYYSARYYSPTLARFISEDPSGTRGGINLYAYAGDQPVTFEDSTGMSPNGGSGTCRPCQAFLRYHPAVFHTSKSLPPHTFWETLDAGDSPGNRQYDSGEPEPVFTFPIQFLNHYQNFAGDDDSWPFSWSSLSSTEVCSQVATLRSMADSWPNWTIFYQLFVGPNSNSFAHYIGSSAGFNATPPPGAIGWDYPLFGM